MRRGVPPDDDRRPGPAGNPSAGEDVRQELLYFRAAIVQIAPQPMKLNFQDLTLKALILVAGSLAAVLLAIKGHGEALPALALGSTLGAVFAGRFGTSQE